jgi:hypothetical protein
LYCLVSLGCIDGTSSSSVVGRQLAKMAPHSLRAVVGDDAGDAAMARMATKSNRSAELEYRYDTGCLLGTQSLQA